jgi:ABC-type multidrug transport system fused ATPase/permease subunit
VASIVGGFAEAGLLVAIARIALALAANHDQVKISLGPLEWNASVGSLVKVAFALVLVRVALQVVQVRFSTSAITSVVSGTRQRLISQYLRAGWPLQSLQRDGRLQQLITGYANASAGAIGCISSLIISGFNLATLLATALIVSVAASLAAAAAALVIGLALRPMRAGVRRRAARSADADLRLATGVTELTSSLQEVRIFGVEQQVGGRLERLISDAARRSLSQARVSGLIQVVYQGIAMLLIVGALGLANAANVTGFASLGAVVLIMIRALSYGQNVQYAVQGLHENAPYLEVLREEQAAYISASLPHGGAPVERVENIAFENVSFEYVPGVPVLHGVSFAVEPGEIVGIVGPSGSGKSTLVQLLLRLRQPTEGLILVGGQDVRELDLDEWYEHVTFVPQDAHLFAGSVSDNIRFFREGIDDSAIERAAKLANLADDIVSWPLGYDTPVGERGGHLSGGQRQRLCIARALVENPDVLVLDEPTSSLDVKSEALIRDTLGELVPHTTIFVIAHRLSTLSICDRIMVVQDGHLRGFDEPETLEATNQFYREALQLSGLR